MIQNKQSPGEIAMASKHLKNMFTLISGKRNVK